MEQSTICLSPAARAPRRRSVRAAWLGAAALGAEAAACLYDARVGINWTLLLVGLAGGVALLGDDARSAARRPLLLLAAAFGGAVAVSGDLPLQLALTIASLWSGAVALRVGGQLRQSAPLGLAALVATPWHALRRVLEESRHRLATGLHLAGQGRHALIARGGLLALPVLTAFFLLLGEADPTFAAWRRFLADAIARLAFFGPALLFAAVALAALGLFGLALHAPQPHAADPDAGRHRRATVSAIEQRIVLGAVVLLLGFFLGLRLGDLFDDPGGRSGSGVTLAEAVHRGFTELTLVATLSAALILALERRVASGGGLRGRALGLLLTGECLLLLVSAQLRLAAYETAYGYTQLRLCVGVYIAVLAFALLALAVELFGRIDRVRLARRAALAAAFAALALGYWNAAGWIVRENVARYARTGQIDVPYLVRGLGADGAAELVHALPGFAPRQRACVLRTLAEDYGASLGRSAPPPAWYEWSLRRAAARAALAGLDLQLPPQTPEAPDAAC
jgi:two-component system sensor histidine kinase BaeS